MSGPPVVLLHGLATSAARTWGENGWIDLLQEAGRTVLAIDLLGHGDAPKPHEPEAYEALEAAVAAQLPDEPVDIIGFSLGARTTLALAFERPGTVPQDRGGGGGRQPLPGRRRTGEGDRPRGGRRSRPRGSHLGVLQPTGRQPRDRPGGVVGAVASQTALPVTREGLATVTNPVLVVLGDQDFAGPADPLVDALPNATFLGCARPTTSAR